MDMHACTWISLGSGDLNSGLHFPYCAVSSTPSSLWTLELLMWKGHLTSEFKRTLWLSVQHVHGRPSNGGQTGKKHRQARTASLPTNPSSCGYATGDYFSVKNSDNHEWLWDRDPWQPEAVMWKALGYLFAPIKAKVSWKQWWASVTCSYCPSHPESRHNAVRATKTKVGIELVVASFWG